MATPVIQGSGTTTALLTATGIEKRFGGVRALQDVDFRVEPGEIVGLVGPNGSGKSTLLACLSRAHDVDAGTIRFDDRDITRTRAKVMARRGMTRTFQNVKVFPELTVRENALLARQWDGVKPWQLLAAADPATGERVDHLLELTEMTRLAGEFAGNLSGGQKRLLELVMALVSKPRLVLLDEASSGVNPTLIESLKGYIRLLHEQEGVSFVIVEHNIGFIFSLASRIVVLDGGRVLADGSPDDIRHNQEVIDAYLGA
ncbi:ABC transporter ATP-binding protein [Aeromicrobium duanguangcaii]|uniref:ABC transporter ATP-binding protein n=1 Tax=Aeromicrobium duanguangcaii TaxID=2968086 RepID=A0ABY5KIT8_9ACTN|nr:ABC transporter ATP-binding protein [Aeromicrobium duanguangcaii]MCD9155072.1 ABC transporter ATP-binding protein [Aeromicrobium duanguangcaii]UUI68273.1 ABC transporter ATP-binding protein [Aeromicrobium duanguangcaii]